MSFLDDFNYIISQTSNNSTRATLEKTFAMLVAQNETRNIDKLLEHWHSLQLKPFGESNIHSWANLRVKIDEIARFYVTTDGYTVPTPHHQTSQVNVDGCTHTMHDSL